MVQPNQEKALALQKAKELWESKTAEDAKKTPTVTVSGKANETIDITEELLGSTVCVLHLQSNHNCQIKFNVGKVAKVLVEQCNDCTVTIGPNCSVLTSTVEVWKCNRVTLNAQKEIGTVQVDLCQQANIIFPDENCLDQVVQAAVEVLDVRFTQSPQSNFVSGLKQMRQQLDNDNPTDKEQQLQSLEDPTTQFISRRVNGKILTEKVVRLVNDFPSTLRENSEFISKTKTGEKDLKELSQNVRKFLGGDVETKKELDEKEGALGLTPSLETPEEIAASRAEAKRLKGNEEFKTGSVNQAILHYTESLLIIQSAAVYANRAACFLKVGELQKALDDTEECLKMDPKYVKAHFRRGVCLMELERYEEACKAFASVLEFEPNHKQAKSSLATADMKRRRSSAKK